VITWIEQVDKGGCGIAALAMLLGVTYARMREMAPQLCGHCGVDEPIMYDVLAENGYAVQRLERMRASDEENRAVWPPKPWAKKHLVCVMQSPEDSVSHWVVMDGRGNVYDPADKEFRKCKLSRYHSVESVTAVLPTGRSPKIMR
jgi:hypothetical protein